MNEKEIPVVEIDLWTTRPEQPPYARDVLEQAIDGLEEQNAVRNLQKIEESFQYLKMLCDRIDGGSRW